MSLLGKVSIFLRKDADRPKYQIMLRDPEFCLVPDIRHNINHPLRAFIWETMPRARQTVKDTQDT